MDNKTFFIKTLSIITWPATLLVLGLGIINLFSFNVVSLEASRYIPGMEISVSLGVALGAIIAAIAASVAAYFAFKTWGLEKLPVVHAMGTFIISTKVGTNGNRDSFIDKEGSQHTLQLINVGRGSAQNVIPSTGKTKERRGRLLEEINPHSFSLPSNQGTKVFKETLRVHGQRFVTGNKYELEFENDRKTAYFYVHFEDYTGKPYLTKAKIERVNHVDDQRLDRLIKDNKGIEIWKVMENINETN